MQPNRLCIALILAGCSTTPSDKPLPGATNTPHFESLVSSIACGQDTAFYGSTTPDLRYAFTYDSATRLTHVAGTWLADNSTEAIDYTWAGDNVTHILGTSSWNGAQSEITAAYDPANHLTDYTWAYTSPDYNDAWTYTFSSFTASGQAAREVITQTGGDTYAYDLLYDANDRLVEAVPATGPSTTWTYDDTARTITVDTGNGAYTSLITYDAQDRELSVTSGGSDPAVIDSEETYDWAGDSLNTMTYRSGSEQAPHQLETVQVDTMRYNCAAARQNVNRVAPLRGPRLGR